MTSSKNATSAAPPQSDELADIMADLDREEAELLALIESDKASREEKLTAVQRSFRERKKQEAARAQQATDSEYWFCVCFLTREQKDAFLRHYEWDSYGDKYIDGVALAEEIGCPLPDAMLRFVESKPDRRLSEISLPLKGES